ncbi:hypothetical protein [[Pseudomonas] boreopolis]|uniref:hypothetical protein n=1 Tax=Xanthomonas boreopolis TaxID=86183 RepID=UPI003D9BC119
MHQHLRGPSPALSGPALSIAIYASLDYRRHYADLLSRHPQPRQAMAELGLFRFWLACRARRPGLPGATPAGDVLFDPARPPRGWPLPLHLQDCDVQDELGAGIVHLVESRFDLYDRFFSLGRHAEDPLGLDAVSLALACQLFTQPPPAILERLRRESRQLFDQLTRIPAGTA